MVQASESFSSLRIKTHGYVFYFENVGVRTSAQPCILKPSLKHKIIEYKKFIVNTDFLGKPSQPTQKVYTLI